jgi:hypothetical protein
MKTKIIIIQTVLILALAGFLFYHPQKQKKPERIIRFPEIKLAANERITQAQMTFQLAHIKAIRNIPVGWYTDILLEPPPNPIFKGSIIVGAAALDSTSELPEFEIESYLEKTEPKAIKATLTVTKDFESQRQIEIQLNKP